MLIVAIDQMLKEKNGLADNILNECKSCQGHYTDEVVDELIDEVERLRAELARK